jgi:hypothetical protein
LGLILGAPIYMLATGGAIPTSLQASLPVLLVAGLLVGFGTRLGSNTDGALTWRGEPIAKRGPSPAKDQVRRILRSSSPPIERFC